jgi:hypothetical protein
MTMSEITSVVCMTVAVDVTCVYSVYTFLPSAMTTMDSVMSPDDEPLNVRQPCDWSLVMSLVVQAMKLQCRYRYVAV